MKDIPKICHLYFGGSSPMSQLMVFTVFSFHKYNPDWRIIVYRTIETDEELGENTYVPYYTGKDYFPLLETLSYVEIKNIRVSDFNIKNTVHSFLGSDLFRTNILYKEGGVYSDFDIIWLKSMDEFVNIDCIGNPNDFDATVCYHNLTNGHHSIGCVIAKQGSKFIDTWMRFQQTVQAPYRYQSFGNKLLAKRFPDLESVQRLFPSILALRYETFYPYSIFNLKKLYLEDDITPISNKNVMGVHWFNGHPLAQEYIKNRNDCSMTFILKQEGYI